MAEVFVSYKRENEARVARLVDALEAHGVTVWWDRSLEHNADFGAIIDSEIDAAKAVIVCWTEESLSSKWVRGEASRADEHGKYCGVMLGRCMPPTPFNTKHNVNLANWSGEADDMALLMLLESIGSKTSRRDLAELASARRETLKNTEDRKRAEEKAGQVKEEREAREAARLAEETRQKAAKLAEHRRTTANRVWARWRLFLFVPLAQALLMYGLLVIATTWLIKEAGFAEGRDYHGQTVIVFNPDHLWVHNGLVFVNEPRFNAEWPEALRAAIELCAGVALAGLFIAFAGAFLSWLAFKAFRRENALRNYRRAILWHWVVVGGLLLILSLFAYFNGGLVVGGKVAPGF